MRERIDLSSILIRAAIGVERKACRMLLNTQDRFCYDEGLHIARTTATSPQVLGALSLTPLRDPQGEGAILMHAHVLPAWRRCGIGSQLLQTAVDAARRNNAHSVIVQCDSQSELEGVSFLDAKGFQRTEVLTTFEASTERLSSHIRGLRDRLLKSNRVPLEARLIDLRDAPIMQVAKLHAEYLAGTPQSITRMLNEQLANDGYCHHCVLMLDQKVVGLVLARTVNGVSTVESEVLDPSYRASAQFGWASVVLLAEEIDWGVARNSVLTHFSCTSGNRATQRLAKRSGAIPIREKIVFCLRLDY